MDMGARFNRKLLIVVAIMQLPFLAINASAEYPCIIRNHPDWRHWTGSAMTGCNSITETSPGVLTCGGNAVTSDSYIVNDVLDFWGWNGTEWVLVSQNWPLTLTAAAKTQLDKILNKYPAILPEAWKPCQDYRFASGCVRPPAIPSSSPYSCIVVNDPGYRHWTASAMTGCNSITETSPGVLTCDDCGLVTSDTYTAYDVLKFWGWDGEKWVLVSQNWPFTLTAAAKAQVDAIIQQYQTITVNDPSRDPVYASGCGQNLGSTCPEQ